MRQKTTNHTSNAHPQFCIESKPEIPESDVEMLSQFLEQDVENGAIYRDDDTIEFGPTLLKSVLINDRLIIHEPDYRSMPITWVRGVSESMWLTRVQSDVVKSIFPDHSPEYCNVRSSLIVGNDLSPDTNRIILSRDARSGTASGWYCGNLDTKLDLNNPDSLSLISVYEAMIRWPNIREYLALPSGFEIAISAKQARISSTHSKIEIIDGSYLAARRVTAD